MGVEEAMAHMNRNASNDWATQGWTTNNNKSTLTRTNERSYYTVTFFGSTARVPRSRLQATRNQPSGNGAIG